MLRGSITTKTLSNWRGRRKGPRAVYVGRAPLYPRAGVLAWLEAEAERQARGWPAA